MSSNSENFDEIVERCRQSLEKYPRDELIGMTFSSLEFMCRQKGEWEKLVRILEARLSLEKMPHARMELFGDLMRIYEEELDHKHLAFLTACRAYRENMDGEDLRLKLESLAEATDSIEEMALVYEEVLDGKVTCTEPGLSVVRRLAKIKEFHLDEKDEAISLWQQAVWAEPEDQEALSSLERLVREQEDFPELANILRLRAKAERSSERWKDVAFELAAIQEEKLNCTREAMVTYLSVLEEDPKDTAAVKLMNRLMGSESGLKQLPDPKTVVRVYQSVLKHRPNDPDVVGGVERLLKIEGCRLQAAQALEPVYRSRSDWMKLVEVLEVRLDGCSGCDERLSLLLQLRETYEDRLEEPALAFSAAARAVAEKPEEKGLCQDLERLAEKQGMFEEAVGIYLDVADGVDGTQVASVLRKRANWICKKHLTGRTEEIQALASLADLYRERGEYSELVDVLRRQVKLERSLERRIDIYYEVAHIAEEKLNRRQEAIEAYLEILAEDKQERAAAKLLNRLYLSDVPALAPSAA